MIPCLMNKKVESPSGRFASPRIGMMPQTPAHTTVMMELIVWRRLMVLHFDMLGTRLGPKHNYEIVI